MCVRKAPAENDVQEARHGGGAAGAAAAARPLTAGVCEQVWEHMDRCGVDYFTSNLPLGLRRWDTERGSPGP